MNKKNALSFLLLGFLVLASSIPADGEQVKVTVSEASLRVKPTLEATVLGKIPQGTKLEVIATLGIWYQVELPPDLSGIIITGYVLQNEVAAVMEKREIQQGPSNQPPPPPPSAPTPQNEPIKSMPAYPPRGSLQGQLYASGLVGIGTGFDKIKVAEVMRANGNWEDVNIFPGGGANLEARLGFYLTSSLRTELSASFHISGRSYEIQGSSNDYTVGFQRFPMNLTIIFDLPKTKKMQIYIGAGPTVSLGARYKEEFVTSYTINYKTAFGFHALVGMMWNKGKWFYYGELCYMGPFKYSWTSATFYPPSFMRELSGNGIMINFGAGILFGQ